MFKAGDKVRCKTWWGKTYVGTVLHKSRKSPAQMYRVKWLDGNTAFYKVSHIEKISGEEFAALLLMEK